MSLANQIFRLLRFLLVMFALQLIFDVSRFYWTLSTEDGSGDGASDSWKMADLGQLSQLQQLLLPDSGSGTAAAVDPVESKKHRRSSRKEKREQGNHGWNWMKTKQSWI